jgi:hypothetical protein
MFLKKKIFKNEKIFFKKPKNPFGKLPPLRKIKTETE